MTNPINVNRTESVVWTAVVVVTLGLIWDLNTRLLSGQEEEINPYKVKTPVEIKLVQVKDTDLIKLIEKIAPPEPEIKKEKPDAIEENPLREQELQEGILPKLYVEENIFRLRGSFMSSNNIPFAAIEKINNKTKSTGIEKYSTGERIGPYRIKKIEQKAVILVGPMKKIIELRLFKKDDGPTETAIIDRE